MTTGEIVETSVTVNNNSRIQDYAHPDDQTQRTFVTQFVKLNAQKAVTKLFSWILGNHQNQESYGHKCHIAININ